MTEDDYTKLRTMWKAGKTPAEIGAELGITTPYVVTLAKEAGLSSGHYNRQHVRKKFTDEQVSAVKVLMSEGTLTLKTAKLAAKVSEERAKDLIWQIRQGLL